MDNQDRTRPHQNLDQQADYICNSCGEAIVIPLDCTQGQQQSYVEDCPVCCNPNVIFVEFDSEDQAHVWSRPESD